MVTTDEILNKLPPFRNEWMLINSDQDVDDIIKEVLQAHEEFQPYYEKFALCFDSDTIDAICDDLYSFCKRNIRYKEETKDDQTSSLPSGVLERGHGDCKHYSGFIAGCLDAINRLTGKDINWCYRFASYNLLDKVPHHVFVVVKKGNNEIWIDPTPGSDNSEPVFFTDKKIKNKMALHRNIGSTSNVRKIDMETVVVTSRNGKWYAWDKNGEIELPEKNQIGLIDDVVDVAGDIVSVAKDAFSFITSIFGGKKNNGPDYAIYVERWPLSANPTAEEVKNQINSIIDYRYNWAQQGKGEGSDWKAAYENAFRKYTAIYNQLAKTNYSAPQQGNLKPDHFPLAEEVNAQSSTPSLLTTSSGKTNWLLIGGIALAAIFFLRKKKRVTGAADTQNILLMAGGLGLLYLLSKKKNTTTEPAQQQQPVSDVDLIKYQPPVTQVAPIQPVTNPILNSYPIDPYDSYSNDVLTKQILPMEVIYSNN